MSDKNPERGSHSFLHPASGGLILGADWLFFSGMVFTGGIGLPVSVGLGFLSGLIGVTCAQRFVAKEGWGKSVAKGLLSGVVVGLPFPIFGTLLGGAVLAMSGLDQMRDRAAAALAETAKGKPAAKEIEGE